MGPHQDTAAKDTAKRQCKQELLPGKGDTEFYDIDDPPTAEEQFAMFPDRAKGHDNLVYILMKMDGQDRVPIVFCVDCLAEKYIRYCDSPRVWEYQYKPCAVDTNFYSPKFYSDLMRRIWTDRENFHVWKQLLPTVSVELFHVDGCIHSSTPEYIIQRKDGLANSIYFRHCGGEYRNIMMQKLEMATGEYAMPVGSGKWTGQLTRNSGPHMVPGLEWRDTTMVQSIHFANDIVHL